MPEAGMMKEPGTLAGYAAYLAARTRQATVYLDLGRETMALFRGTGTELMRHRGAGPAGHGRSGRVERGE